MPLQTWQISELSGIWTALKNLGTPVGSRQFVHEKVTERESGRTKTLGYHPTRSRPAMRVADPTSMRRTAVQTHVAQFATNPVKGVCRGARCRHAADHGGFAGRTPWRRSTQRCRMRIGDASLELGGLAVRSAQRVVPGAFWASWADALHVIHERLPTVARTSTHRLINDAECQAYCAPEPWDPRGHWSGFAGRREPRCDVTPS